MHDQVNKASTDKQTQILDNRWNIFRQVKGLRFGSFFCLLFCNYDSFRVKRYTIITVNSKSCGSGTKPWLHGVSVLVHVQPTSFYKLSQTLTSRHQGLITVCFSKNREMCKIIMWIISYLTVKVNADLGHRVMFLSPLVKGLLKQDPLSLKHT